MTDTDPFEPSPADAWGMYTREGNLAVAKVVRDCVRVRNTEGDVAAARMLLDGITAIARRHPEVYDTDVCDRIFSAVDPDVYRRMQRTAWGVTGR